MSIYAVKSMQEDSLLKKSNVVGVGIGYKETQGSITEEQSVVVLVEKKIPITQLKAGDTVPVQVQGYKTDVVEVGKIKALGYYQKERPAVPGISMGHYDITAGTFGCIVYSHDGFPYILSNNHVLAATNDGVEFDAIYQPGPIDGGSPEDTIGYLDKFIPIGFGEKPPEPPPPPEEECPYAELYLRFGNAMAEVLNRKTRIKQYMPVARTEEVWENEVDCALARPAGPDLVVPEIKEIGIPTGTEAATLGLAVQKTGRTTGHTVGTVRLINASIYVNYGKDEPALFRNQIVCDDMSAGGDSGSLIVTRFNGINAVGLLFAGSTVATIVNPIDLVLSSLNMKMVR